MYRCPILLNSDLWRYRWVSSLYSRLSCHCETGCWLCYFLSGSSLVVGHHKMGQTPCLQPESVNRIWISILNKISFLFVYFTLTSEYVLLLYFDVCSGNFNCQKKKIVCVRPLGNNKAFLPNLKSIFLIVHCGVLEFYSAYICFIEYFSNFIQPSDVVFFCT